MNLNTYFSYWAELYKEDMMNNIMPFWMKYVLTPRMEVSIPV